MKWTSRKKKQVLADIYRAFVTGQKITLHSSHWAAISGNIYVYTPEGEEEDVFIYHITDDKAMLLMKDTIEEIRERIGSKIYASDVVLTPSDAVKIINAAWKYRTYPANPRAFVRQHLNNGFFIGLIVANTFNLAILAIRLLNRH